MRKKMKAMNKSAEYVLSCWIIVLENSMFSCILLLCLSFLCVIEHVILFVVVKFKQMIHIDDLMYNRHCNFILFLIQKGVSFDGV